MIYKCGHCGYRGECYGVPTTNGVSEPYCFRCRRNDRLTRLDPKDKYIRRPDWRGMLEEAGGYANEMAAVPAKGVRPMVAEIEDLRKENILLRLEADSVDGENAAYVRKWIETFRSDPAVEGILRMCNEAIAWREDAERAHKIAEELMSHYDAEGLIGAIGDKMAEKMGLDHESGLVIFNRQRSIIKDALALLQRYEASAARNPLKQPHVPGENPSCTCHRCDYMRCVADLPEHLKPKKEEP